VDTITFSLEELNRLNKKQLCILANYYGLSSKGTKEILVARLDAYYSPKKANPIDVDLGSILLADETAEFPKYSARIRRIYWLQHLEELNGQLDKSN